MWSCPAYLQRYGPEPCAVRRPNIFRDITEISNEIPTRAGPSRRLAANTLDYEDQLAGLARLLVPTWATGAPVPCATNHARPRARGRRGPHRPPPGRGRHASSSKLSGLSAQNDPSAVANRARRSCTRVPALLGAPRPRRCAHSLPKAWPARSADRAASARGRTVGTLSLAWGETGRAFTPADVKWPKIGAARGADRRQRAPVWAEHAAAVAAEAAAQNTSRLQAFRPRSQRR